MDQITVYIRVRPLSIAEKNASVQNIIQVPTSNQLTVKSNQQSNFNEIAYTFKEIFPENAKQCDVFNSAVVPIIKDVLQGYNCTLFAYGSVGSGKSYTMIGDSETDINSLPFDDRTTPFISDDSTIGIIPRTITDLFNNLYNFAANFTVRISYLEIFNEDLIDLLTPNNGNNVPLKVYENTKNQVLVNGLTEVVVRSAAESYAALARGQERLKNHAHANKSHSIFTIMVYIKEKPKCYSGDDNEEVVKFCKLSLVELASNDSSAMKTNDKHTRAKVNQSLASFNRVVQALIDKLGHIPYRDSKLTRILQESLGGNSKTSIIATVASGWNFVEETVNTLDYMARIKTICNKPQINERLNKTVLLKDIAEQINQLKRDILANRTKTGRFLTEDDYNECQNKLNESRTHVKRKKSEMDLLKEEYASVEGVFLDVDSNLRAHNRQLENLRQAVITKKYEVNQIAQAKQDKELMIDRYAHTETILSAQAAEILGAVDIAITDNFQLCETIERRRSADQQINSACETFAFDMKKHFNNMAKYAEKNTDMVQKMIMVYSANHEKFHRTTSEMLDRFKSNTDLLLQKTDVQRKIASNRTVEMAFEVNNVLKENVVATASKQFTPATPFEQFVQMYERQLDIYEKATRSIEKMLLNRSQALTKFTANMETRIKLFHDELSQMIQSCHMTLEQSSKSNEKINQQMLEIYAQLSEMLNKANQNSSVLPTMVRPSLHVIENSIQSSNQLHLSLVQSHEKNIMENKPVLDAATLIKNCKNKMAEMQENSQQRNAMPSNLLKSVSDCDASMSATANDLLHVLSTDLLEKRNIFMKGDDIPKLQNEFSDHAVRVSSENEKVTAMLSDLKSINCQFVDETEKEIKSCGDRLRYFREMDFCQYKSTGATPARREYKTDICLAATTPHDKLKQRFREKMANHLANVDLTFLSK